MNVFSFLKAIDLNGTEFSVDMNKSSSELDIQHSPGTICGGISSLLIIALASSVLIQQIIDTVSNKNVRIYYNTYSLTSSKIEHS